MLAIPAQDTLIGFTLGPDVGNKYAGGYTMAALSFTSFLGYQGKPMFRNYLYPNINNSDWVMKTCQGLGPMHWATNAGPADTTAANILAGNVDARLQQQAAWMVQYGFGEGFYNPGLEGSGNNFAHTAGVEGDSVYGQLVAHNIQQMRKVPGWDNYTLWNYSVADATGFRPGVSNPDAAFAACKGLVNGIEMDQYDSGGWSGGGWTAADHAATWKNDVLPRLMKQLAFADKQGLRMGVGESGSMWRSDGHGGGDSRYYLDHVAAWIEQYNPSHWFFYLGSNLPGDTCRWLIPTAQAQPVNSTSWAVAPQFATQTYPAMRELFDPVHYLGKDPSMYQQLKAVQSQLSTVTTTDQATVSSLQSQLSSLQAQVSTLQASNTGLTSKIASAKAVLG